MARKSVRSLLLTALLATPLLSYATQYPLTVTDLDESIKNIGAA